MAASDFKKIIIITSPISKMNKGIESLDYFAALVSLLTKKIQSKYKAADIILKIPGSLTNDFHADQIEFLKQASKLPDVDYIIVSPKDVSLFYDELKDLIQPLIKLKKIIFIDQGFEYQTPAQVELLKTQKIEIPPYVQANWVQGGEIAAESVYKYLQEESVNIKSPHIVILEGGIGSIERVDGFVSYLNKKSSETGNNFYPTYFKYNAEYDRIKAKDFFASYLEVAIASKNPIDIIFTTNDEMGLGVREALIDGQKKYKEQISDSRKNLAPKIFGFDGILDFTLLIDKYQEDFAYDTVLVDLDKQIDSVLTIIEYHNNKKTTTLKDEQLFVPTKCQSFREKYKKELKK